MTTATNSAYRQTEAVRCASPSRLSEADALGRSRPVAQLEDSLPRRYWNCRAEAESSCAGRSSATRRDAANSPGSWRAYEVETSKLLDVDPYAKTSALDARSALNTSLTKAGIASGPRVFMISRRWVLVAVSPRPFLERSCLDFGSSELPSWDVFCRDESRPCVGLPHSGPPVPAIYAEREA